MMITLICIESLRILVQTIGVGEVCRKCLGENWRGNHHKVGGLLIKANFSLPQLQ